MGKAMGGVNNKNAPRDAVHFGAFTKPLDQLYQVRGYTPVTPGSASGYTTEVNYMT